MRKARTGGRTAHRRLDRGNAPEQQLELPSAARRGEAAGGASGRDAAGGDKGVMARVVERGNLLAPLARVKRQGGSPGVDGMTVEALPGYLREQGPQIREALVAGTYRPQPVKRVEIPQPGAGYANSGCLLCWTGSSSKRRCRGCSRHGRSPFRRAAMGSVRGDRRIRRRCKPRGIWGRAMAGW